jgi:hypothetical protein
MLSTNPQIDLVESRARNVILSSELGEFHYILGSHAGYLEMYPIIQRKRLDLAKRIATIPISLPKTAE